MILNFFKRTLLYAFLLISINLKAQEHRFFDHTLDVETRIDDLLSKMTLEEKVSALSTDPSVPRLGVKGSQHLEGYHGIVMGGPANWAPKGNNQIPTTQFPQAYGMGATWNIDLVEEMGEVQSIEARYIFQSQEYNNGALIMRAPNADLGRDPRWGRTEEVFGEDPFLVGEISLAFAKGLQGYHPKYWRTASLLKHYLANSNEDGRDSSSSNFDDQLYYDYYSYPFRKAITKGGVNAYMASYNAINGTPSHIHPYNKDVAMKKWGLDGIICTDGGGYRLLVTAHKAFDTYENAAAAIIKSGINQFLDNYKDGVETALKKKLLTEKDIDETLRGVYRVMIKLGLLDKNQDNPYQKLNSNEMKIAPWNTESHKNIAVRAAQESVVLLKNDGLLPLNKDKIEKIAVIGWLADTLLIDWYGGIAPNPITPLAGLQNKLGEQKIVYAKDNLYNAAVEAAENADVAIVVLGNNPITVDKWADSPDPAQGKEGIDRKSLNLYDESLVQWVFDANPNTILVLQSNFPYAINWSQQNLPAILHITHSGQAIGMAMADVIFGDYNPAGRLVQSWPKSLRDIPEIMEYDIRKGHTYLYNKNEPLYPFGHGLSYAKFEYKEVTTIVEDEEVTVKVKIKNVSDIDGDEVIQVYVSSDVKGQPIKALKGFKRVSFNTNELKEVEIKIPIEELKSWDMKKEKYRLPNNNLKLHIGSSSADIKFVMDIIVN